MDNNQISNKIRKILKIREIDIINFIIHIFQEYKLSYFNIANKKICVIGILKNQYYYYVICINENQKIEYIAIDLLFQIQTDLLDNSTINYCCELNFTNKQIHNIKYTINKYIENNQGTELLYIDELFE